MHCISLCIESEYINILPEEASRKSHKGNHDYLMLLPGEKGSSSGTKRSDNKDYINLETVEDTRSKPPPPKPLPYHQTRHAYVNTTSATVPESQLVKSLHILSKDLPPNYCDS